VTPTKFLDAEGIDVVRCWINLRRLAASYFEADHDVLHNCCVADNGPA
jgi:hypothetical protein